jgi:hypothetical protein
VDLHTEETELPFCVIVPNYLELPLHYIEYSLNSIFRQDYSHYRAVLFSSPREELNAFVLRYLEAKSIAPERYIFVQSFAEKTAVENVYAAVHYYCPQDSVATIVEGGN